MRADQRIERSERPARAFEFCFNTDPQGATVRVDGQEVGHTPCTVEISRQARRAEYVMPGCQVVSVEMPRTFNSLSILNVFNAGLGSIVDIATGDVAKAEPAAFARISRQGP